MTSLLCLHGLQKHFGQALLLDIDILDIAASSAYVLTGTNGAGKSTLLRILSGLEPAQVAKTFFFGKPIHLRPYPSAMREAIVYVHQHPVMFCTSVKANIAYGLRMRGMPAKEIEHRVQAAMEWAGVTHLTHHHPSILSGGEKQRIALARAKILEPKLLLLDEPTSNLDGPAREQVIKLIQDMIGAGSSVMMACHDRELIGMPGVRRLKLRDGRVEVKS